MCGMIGVEGDATGSAGEGWVLWHTTIKMDRNAPRNV